MPVALVFRGGLLRACALALLGGGAGGIEVDEDAPPTCSVEGAGMLAGPASFLNISSLSLIGIGAGAISGVSLPPGSFDM